MRKRANDRREATEIVWPGEVRQGQEDRADTPLGQSPVTIDVAGSGSGVVATRERRGGTAAAQPFDYRRDVFAVTADGRDVEHGDSHLGRFAAGSSPQPKLENLAR